MLVRMAFLCEVSASIMLLMECFSLIQVGITELHLLSFCVFLNAIDAQLARGVMGFVPLFRGECEFNGSMFSWRAGTLPHMNVFLPMVKASTMLTGNTVQAIP